MDAEAHSYPDALSFRFRRRSLAWRLLGTLAISAVCLGLAFVPDAQLSWQAILGSTFAGIFGLFALQYLLGMLSRRPAVLLTPEGIVNHSLFGGTRIEWHDIAAIVPYTEDRQQYVGVIPRDPDDFIARQSLWRRFWLRLYGHLAQAPFNIWTSALSVTPDEFWRQLMRYGSAYAPRLFASAVSAELEEGSRGDSRDDETADHREHPAPGEDPLVPPEHVVHDGAGRHRNWRTLTLIVVTPLVFFGVSEALALYLPSAHSELEAPITIAAIVAGVGLLLAGIRQSERALADLGLAWCFFLGGRVLASAQGWPAVANMLGATMVVEPLTVILVMRSRLNRLLQDVLREEANAEASEDADDDDAERRP